MSPSINPARACRVIAGYPLVGAIPQLVPNPIHLFDGIVRDHPGEIVRLNLGPVHVYVATHPDQVQHIFSGNSRNFGRSPMYRPVQRMFGKGLVTREGESWFRGRRLMQPVFKAKQLADLADTMATVAVDALARMESAGSGVPIDMGRLMEEITRSVMLKAMFGTSIDLQQAEAVGAEIQAAFQVLFRRIFLYFLPDWVPLPGDGAFRRAVRDVDALIFDIIRERRRNDGGRNDLLTLLMRARDDETHTSMDDQQLRDELVTMYIAGYETTSAALTWVWYLLDRHPAVDRRLRAEVDAVLGTRMPTFADLGNLSYTKMIIEETLRLYPTIWFMPRVAYQDDVIDGYAIEAGATVLLSNYVTHRLPEFWDQPKVFDPERFTPERVAARRRYSYFPFGGGAHQCIGNHFAMMEAQIIVATMAQRFRPRCAPGHSVEPHAAITIRPRNGLKMTLDSTARDNDLEQGTGNELGEVPVTPGVR